MNPASLPPEIPAPPTTIAGFDVAQAVDRMLANPRYGLKHCTFLYSILPTGRLIGKKPKEMMRPSESAFTPCAAVPPISAPISCLLSLPPSKNYSPGAVRGRPKSFRKAAEPI